MHVVGQTQQVGAPLLRLGKHQMTDVDRTKDMNISALWTETIPTSTTNQYDCTQG